MHASKPLMSPVISLNSIFSVFFLLSELFVFLLLPELLPDDISTVIDLRLTGGGGYDGAFNEVKDDEVMSNGVDDDDDAAGGS